MFLLTWLGSMIFWIAWFCITFVGAYITFRVCCKDSYKVLFKGAIPGEKAVNYCEKGEGYALLATHMLFWWVLLPFIVIVYMFRYAFELAIGPAVLKVFRTIDKSVPSIKFGK